MPLITVNEKVISTNDVNLHTRLKMKAAELRTSLGKLVDIYLRRGYQLELEKEENFERIKNILEQ